MNSLADTLLLGSPTPERRSQAELWVKKAIAVIEDTKSTSAQNPAGSAHCELVLAAALFNLGYMREVRRDFLHLGCRACLEADTFPDGRRLD